MTALPAAVLETTGDEAVVLEHVGATASIDDLMAEVTVEQRYRNTEPAKIEAVYTFPLPLDAVLMAFEAEFGGRRLAGRILERAKAAELYEDTITDRDSAVLLEQTEPGMFTANVGNLGSGETATIRFRYAMLLRWNGDRVRFRMPTTIAPRYGDPARAGLEPHQVPVHGLAAERRFSLRVTVRGLLANARFSSPTHDVRVAPADGAKVIDLAGDAAMDRDFALEARSGLADASSALAAPDPDGWVALASFRPQIPDAEVRQRRSIRIVVDCSGSMGGDSIAQARRGLERILDGLREGDCFEIIRFGSGHEALFGRDTEVSDAALATARAFVRRLDGNMGGTEIGAALDAAYGVDGDPELMREVLLVTDGQVWDDGSLLARARHSGHRVFTVGVGSAAAEGLVGELAEATGGACELAAPRDDMAVRIHRHFQRMYAPRARSAAVRWPDGAVRRMPERLDTVFGGDTVHVYGWFADRPEGSVHLDVTLADGGTATYRAPLRVAAGAPAERADDDAPADLARLAAARRLDAMKGGKAATALAVRYRLMSPWTSCIVVHMRADGDKAADLPKLRRVPQVMAAGWHGMGSVEAMSELAGSRQYRVTDARVSASLRMDLPAALRRPQPRRKLRSLADYDGPAPMESRHARHSPERPESWPADVPQHSPAHAASAADLVNWLNSWPADTLPTLEDLAAWGVPDPVLAELRRALEDGGDEIAIVAAFLHELSGRRTGGAFGRPLLRQTLSAFKAHGPGPEVIGAARKAVTDWEAVTVAGA